jgi:hypothetical protein
MATIKTMAPSWRAHRLMPMTLESCFAILVNEKNRLCASVSGCLPDEIVVAFISSSEGHDIKMKDIDKKLLFQCG